MKVEKVKDYVEYNLNNSILVKLHDEAYQIWKDYDDKSLWLMPSYIEPINSYKSKADNDGYVMFQMWHFIEIFGAYIGIGKNTPFDLTFRIPQRLITTPTNR